MELWTVSLLLPLVSLTAEAMPSFFASLYPPSCAEYGHNCTQEAGRGGNAEDGKPCCVLSWLTCGPEGTCVCQQMFGLRRRWTGKYCELDLSFDGEEGEEGGASTEEDDVGTATTSRELPGHRHDVNDWIRVDLVPVGSFDDDDKDDSQGGG
jgi:hypothetical protein